VCCESGFTAAVGWDPLTGLGSLKFDKLNTMSMVDSRGEESTTTATKALSVTVIFGICLGTVVALAVLAVVVSWVQGRYSPVSVSPVPSPHSVVYRRGPGGQLVPAAYVFNQ